MLGFPTQKQYVIAPVCLMLILIAMEIAKPLSLQWLGFTYDDIINGQIWRLVTGQLLHTNFNHVLLNLAGVLLVWALHGEYYTAKHYMLVISSSLVLVGVTLFTFTEYQNYAGLSGILHSLIVYGAIIDIRKGEKTGWLLLLGILAKILHEVMVGPAAYTKELINASVAVEAHAIGAVVGILMGLGYLFYIKKRPNIV